MAELQPAPGPRFTPATTVRDAYRACSPDLPLRPGDPRYVEFAPWRGGDHLPQKLSTRIEWKDDPEDPDGYGSQYATILVAGHKGCGKSTELLRLQRKLENEGFVVILFDSTADIDINDADYADVLLALLFRVVEAAGASEVYTLNPDLVDEVAMSLARLTFERETKEEIEDYLSAELGITGEIPLFAKVRAAYKSLLRSTETTKASARRVVKRRPEQFLDDLNLVVNDFQAQISEGGGRGLVVILDSLDRIVREPVASDRNAHNQIFIDHANHLKTPNCHLVYTVPLALCYNENVPTHYPDGVFVLPMVKVIGHQGDPCQGGIDVLGEAIASRVDIDRVFSDPRLHLELCQFSGGNARDLFRLVRYACESASGVHIDAEAVQAAKEALVRDYDLFVKDEDLDKLVRVHRERRLPRDEAYGHLPHDLLVLEYQNAKRWADVHPAVQRTEAFSRKLAAASDLFSQPDARDADA